MSAARPPEARTRAARLEFHAATADRWDDVARLFGPKGACAGCWCMWPRQSAAEFREGRGDGNRRELQRIVGRDERPGILAYLGGEPVAWCAFAPRAAYRRLTTSRVLAPVDERPVWSVVCFYVSRAARGRGVTVQLLREAARVAASRGARVLEGYPIDPGDRRTAAAFAWTGLASAFRRAGFREVARRSATRPIMRKTLRRAPGIARPTARAAKPTRRG